jgi:hypothetical protein
MGIARQSGGLKMSEEVALVVVGLHLIFTPSYYSLVV